jgi:hypothetical protein
MSRQRDHRRDYQRRVALARTRGFTSLRQQQKAPRQIRGVTDLQALPESARDARNAALRTVRTARKQRISIEAAAAVEGVPLPAVRWWADSTLQPRRAGVTQPTRGDRLLRLKPLVVRGEPGTQFVVVRGSGAAQRAAKAFAVQWRYVNGQATADELRRLGGLRIGGQDVEADPDVLDEIARRGELDPSESYRELFG